MPSTRATSKKAPAEESSKSSTTTTSVSSSSPPPNKASKRKPNQKADPEPEPEAKRAKTTQSKIIEKGIIYFLTRGRVNTTSPSSISELQRTHFVLSPLAEDQKIPKGPIPENNADARLIAIPKKTLPKSHNDRFMAFVEKANTSVQDLKKDFFEGYERETKTQGTSKTPPVTLVGEGVYAITLTDHTSHLAYMLAIPSELGEVQRDIGLDVKGSFVLSLKNPDAKGPSYAQLPQKPDFPKEILDEFDGLRWMPVQKTQHLDFANSQLLLIGDGHGTLGGAVSSNGGEKQGDEEEDDDAKETLEELEDQEEDRVSHLHGDDSIFDDLHISKSDYGLKSSW